MPSQKSFESQTLPRLELLDQLVSAELCSGIPARALYVHVPFCRRRCGYCDFPLVAGRDHWIDEYLRAIQRESREFVFLNPLQSIFLGGGTPTQLSVAQLDRLFEIIDDRSVRDSHCEVTIEANPNDVRPDMIECFKRNRVTRVSLGAQSFQAAKLDRLDRTHTSAQVGESARALLQQKFSVNVDLIFGVVDDQMESWTEDLQIAIDLGVQHVSTYHLTVEKGTAFWSRRQQGEPLEVAEDLGADLYEQAIEKLTAAGFEHYEISNFCRPGHACRHNLSYWSGVPYLGWGPGAASFCHGIRWKNHPGIAMYLRQLRDGKSPIEFSERLSTESAARERLVFGLRRMAGVDRAEFHLSTGHPIDDLMVNQLESWISAGLIVADEQTVRLTRRGLMVSDSLWPDLL